MKEVIIEVLSRHRRVDSAMKEIISRDLLTQAGLPVDSALSDLYNYLYPEKVKTCDYGKSLSFVNMERGYKFCEIGCACSVKSKSDKAKCRQANMTDEDRAKLIAKTKATNIERYGVDAPSKSPTVAAKIKETNLERYGVECVLQSQTVRSKIKNTLIDTYGVDNPAKSVAVKENIAKTNIEKYGSPCVFSSPEIQAKISKTNIEKYGCSNPFSNDAIQDNIRGTRFAETGYRYPSQVPEIKTLISQTIHSKSVDEKSAIMNKRTATNVEKYGVEHVLSLPEVRKQLTIMSNEKCGRDYHFQAHISPDSLEKLYCEEWMRNELLTSTIREVADKLGVSPTAVLRKAHMFSIPLIRKHQSAFEREVGDYIESVCDGVVRGDRSVLNGCELDVYLPQLNLAFECNGSYWHSELSGKTKEYHVGKTNQCKSNGIQLIHIWEHQWNTKKDLIKRRILSKICINNRVYARKTVIKELSAKEAGEFIALHHVQGNCQSSIRYGLVNNGSLCAVMTFGKARYSDIQWELLRYCSDGNVIGGASKLFARFVNDHCPTSVVSYSDRQWNTGAVYSKLGFVYSHTSRPSAHYTKNYILFESRIKYQKHKLEGVLESYDSSMSAWENMKANGYDRIWDCGNDVWIWKTKNLTG